MSKHVAPAFKLEAFNCPRCGVRSPQTWHIVSKANEDHLAINKADINTSYYQPFAPIPSKPLRVNWHLHLSVCDYCREYAIWENKIMIYPFETGLPEAHENMPGEVKDIYLEATLVFNHSPRAAAALLRLAIETLIPLLEDYQIKKAKINTMIGALVEKGIPEHIQQGLDAIRIYGNEGIHPGDIILNENIETVIYLFELTNEMVEELIARKNKIRKFYGQIPAKKTEGIANRDKITKK
ncbi:DUF4145 domain-containing protein [Priestia megaterium]|uniref:DUF4145 domain-containing protein n=1 Tax=Priestia megaterium TaxID=1404 RepID=UPI0011537350